MLLCVLNMKIKAQPSCVRNCTVFLEHVLEIQGCGDIVLMKYQLMVCESCILIMLMFIFFLLPSLEKQYVECVNEFFLPLENSICFSLFTLTHAVFSTAALKACSVIAKAIFKCQTIIDYVK